MPLPTGLIDQAVATAPTDDNIRADLKTAANTFYDSLVTTLAIVGATDASPRVIQFQAEICRTIELAAIETKDYAP
ncbi:MAG: hypothetical protein K8T91_20110 [Planctomycetes bacterium]|nr:hypothetical protein [Planctomycetota bacterium]